jgi:hypothetical protein
MITFTKRERDFDTLYMTIQEIISRYLRLKTEDSRQQEVSKFSHVLEQMIWPSKSLLTLYERTKEFAQSLRSTGNYLASFLVSDETLKYYGSGSTLKHKLEKALEPAYPYAVEYIFDEIEVGHRRHLFAQSSSVLMVSVRLDDLDHLSEDSKEVLRRALTDDALQEEMNEDAIAAHHKAVYDRVLGDIVEACEREKRYRRN